jgi:5-methylcytosine-specific restriction protein B
VTGAPQSEKTISKVDAIAIARKHRDELLAGTAVLEQLPREAADQLYLRLQGEISQKAPSIADLAWAHKYFSLSFPDKLDDYHNHRWQRFHLIKLLQLPPSEEGLYVAAGRFVQLASEFGWPMNHLTATLNQRNGPRPTTYWRIGTRLGQSESIWQAMRDGGYVAIGWDAIGDLSAHAEESDLKETIREKLQQNEYATDAKTLSRKAGEIRNFVQRIAEGDVVVAVDGQRVLGTGRVTDLYRYENTPPERAPHRRAVEWESVNEWVLPEPGEGKLTTVFELKRESNLIEIERRRLETSDRPSAKPPVPTVYRSPRLEGIPGQIQAILDRKGQVVVYGPPGTGKTYRARRTILDLAALRAFGRTFAEVSVEEKAEVEGSKAKPGLVRSCTFHPGYGYEDFLEGFRPSLSGSGTLVYRPEPGIFKSICTDALKQQNRHFFLLVDEINRGDIPRIFGELLTLLEKDKRGVQVTLPISRESFTVPANVYVVGTMNTADRSIALLDTALRRRFGFLELMPDSSVLGSVSVENVIPLGPWIDALNDRIRERLGRDARNLQIGHAYLLENGKPITDFSRFVHILHEDIVPLLEEYCYDDFTALGEILGKPMVDESKQRVRHELFEPENREKLVQALLASAPEVVTSPDALLSSSAAEESDEFERDSSAQ